jgi:hypothetical protein
LVVATGEQVALVVDHCDALWRQSGDRGGHQVLHRRDLSASQDAARLEHDGGGRRLVVMGEDLFFRDDEVHAHAVDAVDGLDRARQLALQRAQPVDVLNECGGAEGVRLVEDLIADARSRQIVGGERHAQLGDVVCRNQDRAAVALGLVLDVHRVELGGDSRGIARLQSREQDGLGRLCQRARHIEEERGQRCGNASHDAEPRRTDRFDEFRQCALRSRTRGVLAPC